MTGNEAFKFLSSMTEEERDGVVIVWFDDEQAGNLVETENEKYFLSLSRREQGKLLERGLYSECGDINAVFDSFLDGFVEQFESAIKKKKCQ